MRGYLRVAVAFWDPRPQLAPRPNVAPGWLVMIDDDDYDEYGGILVWGEQLILSLAQV